MQLITLNAWGGNVKEPLREFIKARAETDIFCFQEVYHDAREKLRDDFEIIGLFELFTDLQALLPNHLGIFCPMVEDFYGLAIFVKKPLEIVDHGKIKIYHNPAYGGRGASHDRDLQWLEITDPATPGQKFLVVNVHGLWTGKGKGDTPDRLEQSKRIKDFINEKKLPTILAGDFNLLPDTQSVAILAEGMQNLIKDYKITSTRTSLYERAATGSLFADYIFVSPEFTVKTFQVLPDEVSDHAALFVEVD